MLKAFSSKNLKRNSGPEYKTSITYAEAKAAGVFPDPSEISKAPPAGALEAFTGFQRHLSAFNLIKGLKIANF